jgi:hypothetical protein
MRSVRTQTAVAANFSALDQVGDDLGKPVRVDPCPAVGGVVVDARPPRATRRGSPALRGVGHHLVDRQRRQVQRELVGLQPGEVEQVADEPFESTRLV